MTEKTIERMGALLVLLSLIAMALAVAGLLLLLGLQIFNDLSGVWSVSTGVGRAALGHGTPVQFAATNLGGSGGSQADMFTGGPGCN
jgi:hypothetical protein